MASPISLPKGYKRLGAFPIDTDSVFTETDKMEAYISGASSYPGQVVALVNSADNTVSLYKILPDRTYLPSGGSPKADEHIEEVIDSDNLCAIFDGETSYVILAAMASGQFSPTITGSLILKDIGEQMESDSSLTSFMAMDMEMNGVSFDLTYSTSAIIATLGFGEQAAMSVIDPSALPSEPFKLGYEIKNNEVGGVGIKLLINDQEPEYLFAMDSSESFNSEIVGFYFRIGCDQTRGMLFNGKIGEYNFNSSLYNLHIPNAAYIVESDFAMAEIVNITSEIGKLKYPHSDNAIFMENGKTLNESDKEIREIISNNSIQIEKNTNEFIKYTSHVYDEPIRHGIFKRSNDSSCNFFSDQSISDLLDQLTDDLTIEMEFKTTVGATKTGDPQCLITILGYGNIMFRSGSDVDNPNILDFDLMAGSPQYSHRTENEIADGLWKKLQLNYSILNKEVLFKINDEVISNSSGFDIPYWGAMFGIDSSFLTIGNLRSGNLGFEGSIRNIRLTVGEHVIVDCKDPNSGVNNGLSSNAIVKDVLAGADGYNIYHHPSAIGTDNHLLNQPNLKKTIDQLAIGYMMENYHLLEHEAQTGIFTDTSEINYTVSLNDLKDRYTPKGKISIELTFKLNSISELNIPHSLFTMNGLEICFLNIDGAQNLRFVVFGTEHVITPEISILDTSYHTIKAELDFYEGISIYLDDSLIDFGQILTIGSDINAWLNYNPEGLVYTVGKKNFSSFNGYLKHFSFKIGNEVLTNLIDVYNNIDLANNHFVSRLNINSGEKYCLFPHKGTTIELSNGKNLQESINEGDLLKHDRYTLNGQSKILTSFNKQVSIKAISKHINITGLSITNIDNSEETPLITDSLIEELPVIISSGDYQYNITYSNNENPGLLIIEFN